jgi:TPR repeat protein
MYSRSDFSKWVAILIFIISKINSQESEIFINDLNQPTQLQINQLLNFNHTEYISICEEGDTLYCYKESLRMLKEYKFLNPKYVKPESHYATYNKIVSEFWYYAGHIEYWGLVKKKANLNEGLEKFITSAFFGNSKAFYKLYIITETDLMPVIVNSKEFQNLIRTREQLKYIFDTKLTNFSLNFSPQDDYAKNSISLQFLYTSAIAKFPPAMTALAYKYYKGYGVSRSCETALKYYKETSYQNIKSITNRKKPNFYEKINIATYEYIGHKFSNEILDVEDIIEYFKVEAQNGQIAYIQQLGQRYLYGQGIPQDFNQAFYYFGIGSKLNDSVSIFYLGEMYLNGWGTEKNYSEAFRLFSQAMNLNNAKAWNSLGYMYYYGLGVEKNIRRAYDYFKISFSKGEESDAYYNMISLLTEGNEKIDVDFPNAYKYANFIAAKGHTYGTYFFGITILI